VLLSDLHKYSWFFNLQDQLDIISPNAKHSGVHMARCFVIQPFDRGSFDKRYEDTFKAAIIDAGLEPYRVDQDPGVTIPIEDIEQGIRDSDICFAEISTDNPNVWFELGFAVAVPKEIVLVCSDERENKFPFDVQHRNIITYQTESASDFDALRKKITQRITALLGKRKEIDRLSKPASVAETNGLSQHELVALVIVMQNSLAPEEPVGTYTVKRDMNDAGFSDIAVSIALKSLVRKDMVVSKELADYNGNPYYAYLMSPKGEQWLMDHQELLELRIEGENAVIEESKVDDNDDLPF
jgi:hypothetical protein